MRTNFRYTSIDMRSLFGIAAALLFVGCHEGSGSDIGPEFNIERGYSYRVLVLDDRGEPVVGARVTMSGSTAAAATGSIGRASYPDALSGERRLTVDGTNGSSREGALLGTLTIQAMPPSGDELPYAFHLPDIGPSLGLAVNPGPQPATLVLDDDPAALPADTARSGARLTIQSGEIVTPNSSSNEVRTAKLSPGHLPLPVDGFPVLASRAIYVHPPQMVFAMGAGLSIPDDLNVVAGRPLNLFWLNPAEGKWELAGTAAESGGRLESVAGVKNGGLYAFAITPPGVALVTGRVLDTSGNPVDGVLVRASGVHGRTDPTGRFSLDAVARFDGQGITRTVMVEFNGGRNSLPTRVVETVVLNASTIDLADVLLPTRPAADLSLLLINRGLAVVARRFSVSSRTLLGDATGVLDDEGIVHFEDLPADVIGYVHAFPRDPGSLYRSRSSLQVNEGEPNATVIFASRTDWRSAPSGGTLLQVVDRFGTGPLPLAHVITDAIPGLGYGGLTDPNGFYGVSVDRSSVATAVMQTELGGQLVTSAFTVGAPDGGRVEVPIERARTRRSPFGRFGVFAGELTGAAAGPKDRQLRVSGAMTRQDFYDLVRFGTSASVRTPTLAAAPATSTTQPYRAALPIGRGYISAVEGVATASGLEMEQLGLGFELTAKEGESTALDIPLTPIAAQVFSVTSALTNLDPRLPLTDLRVDLAGTLPNGLVVDLVRDLGGSTISATSAGAQLALPAVPPQFRSYVAMLGARSTVGGVTVEQTRRRDARWAGDTDCGATSRSGHFLAVTGGCRFEGRLHGRFHPSGSLSVRPRATPFRVERRDSRLDVYRARDVDAGAAVNSADGSARRSRGWPILDAADLGCAHGFGWHRRFEQ